MRGTRGTIARLAGGRFWDHPRVWGNTRLANVTYAAYGIIPACGEHSPAIPFTESLWGSSPVCGNTNIPIIAVVDDRDHPRVCGEHYVYFSVERRDSRIIPACAGEHTRYWAELPPCPGSSRVCGEHGASTITPPAVLGSSPRVRGTPNGHSGRQFKAGIIPRVRGTRRIVQFAHSPYGIISRVRGTRRHDKAKSYEEGIIPACAGNTGCRSTVDIDGGIIPACGEH